ncbi:MAG: hypothetical protein ABI205_09760 [Gemmatimonadaceae bacterium]
MDRAVLGGVEVIAVSGDDAERARQTVTEWKPERFTVGFGQPVASMRE